LFHWACGLGGANLGLFGVDHALLRLFLALKHGLVMAVFCEPFLEPTCVFPMRGIPLRHVVPLFYQPAINEGTGCVNASCTREFLKVNLAAIPLAVPQAALIDVPGFFRQRLGASGGVGKHVPTPFKASTCLLEFVSGGPCSSCRRGYASPGL